MLNNHLKLMKMPYNDIKSIRKSYLKVDDYADGILRGDRTLFSQAITLVESKLPQHQELAQQIIEKCLPYSGNSVRIGITGVPGVEKYFIEAWVCI